MDSMVTTSRNSSSLAFLLWERHCGAEAIIGSDPFIDHAPCEEGVPSSLGRFSSKFGSPMHEANSGSRPLGTHRWPLRLAVESDASALEHLVQVSVRELQAPYYSEELMDAALGPVFGVDRQLIRDGTYFLAESGGEIVGCGGWSKRASRFGGDSARGSEDALLDPRKDAARIRAFFVHPSIARQGIGHSIMVACEGAIAEAGFDTIEIVATLAGEPLYASFNYAVVRRYDIELKGGLGLPAVEMAKKIDRVM